MPVATPVRVMRAKFIVQKVERHFGGSETLHMTAVAAKSYSADGSDEDNTYAKFSPSGVLQLTITNPELIGKFNPGEKMYIDFSPAPA